MDAYGELCFLWVFKEFFPSVDAVCSEIFRRGTRKDIEGQAIQAGLRRLPSVSAFISFNRNIACCFVSQLFREICLLPELRSGVHLARQAPAPAFLHPKGEVALIFSLQSHWYFRVRLCT